MKYYTFFSLIHTVLLQFTNNKLKCLGDNGAASPIAIRIDGCPGAICEVKRGSKVNYQIDFRTSMYNCCEKNLFLYISKCYRTFFICTSIDTAGSSIQIQMQVQVFGQTITVPIPPEQANGCRNLLVGSCPYQNNQLLTHTESIDVPRDVPTGLVVTIIASYVSPSGVLACAKVQGYAS